jgi:hypothetical protein
MPKHRIVCLLSLTIALCGMFFCSSFDDTTDLGNNIINATYPGKMDILKHFREYEMDTGSLMSSFSVPAEEDTGFGVHGSMTSHIVVGTQGNESAYGFVLFRTDTSTAVTKRAYSTIDTVISVAILFARDSLKSGGRIAVLPSRNHPSASDTGGAGFDTLTFTHDTAHVNVRDTAVLTGAQLKDSIVFACTTANQTVAKSLPLDFGFILKNLDPAGRIFINGIPTLEIIYKNKNDTTTRKIDVGAHETFYYTFETDNAASQGMPVLSYASTRTAVFKYDMTKLWRKADSALTDTMRAEVVSAAFTIKNPDKAIDTFGVRLLVWHELLHDGLKLDTLFADKGHSDSIPSYSVGATIPGTAITQVDVRAALRAYEQGIPAKRGARPPALYLYIRYSEDAAQVWKKSDAWTVGNAPLLNAVIAVP